MPKPISVCFIGDTHNAHDQYELERSDYLIHTGDLTNYGSPSEIAEGLRWLREVGRSRKGVAWLPGNHDVMMAEHDFAEAMQILVPEVAILGFGIRSLGDLLIASCPWINDVRGYPFCTDEATAKHRIENTLLPLKAKPHLLVTHAPPHGVLDVSDDPARNAIGGMQAYTGLAARLGAQVHAFGHIHESSGTHVADGVTYVNCAALGRDYQTPIHHGRITFITV